MAMTQDNNPSNVREAMGRAKDAQEKQGGSETRSESRRDDNRDNGNDRRDRNDRDSRNDGRRNDRDDRDDDRRSRRSAPNARVVGLGQIGSANPTPLAMTNGAEVLEQFRRDFVEALPAKEDNNALNVNVFAIDSAVAGIPFSVVVVAGTKRGAESLGVGYHTFLLAESAETLRPREENNRGQRVTIVQVPSDGYQAATRKVVKEVLLRHYGDNVNLYTADAEVIQEGFPTFKDDPTAIGDCVKNAQAAIKTAIDRHDPQVVHLSIAEDATGKSFNTIHVQHRQNHVFDRAHQPVRADIIIDMQSRQGGRESNSRDQIDQLVTGTRVTRIGGFFDFVYAPAEGAGGNDFYRNDNRRGRNDENQLYALRFIQTLTESVNFSPTTMLLAMATAMAIGDKGEIMRAFEPNLALGEQDPRNPGWLAIEPNLQNMERGFGTRINTKDESFNAARREALLRTTVRPGIIQSIDIDECGAATWQHTDLLAAAQGDTKAMNRLYDAACILTGGAIEDYHRRGDMIIDTHIERIHGGYYTEGGVKFDLRDMDSAWLMNMLMPETDEDMEVFHRFGMASCLGEDNINSQSERYEIMRQFMPNMVVNKYFQRYNFTTNWCENMSDAMNDCKFPLNPTSTGRDDRSRIRTTYDNLDSVLNRAGNGGLYRNQRSNRHRDDDRYDRSDRNDGRW